MVAVKIDYKIFYFYNFCVIIGGIMQKNIWAKTILTSYRFLEKVADSIDRLVETKALNSFYMSGQNFSKNNVYVITESLINLSERKKKLINIKLLTEKALQNCQKDYAQILIERYIDGDKAKEISLRHELSMRTYFRRLNSAETQFLCLLSQYGFNENYLQNYLLTEKWILDIYSKFATITREEVFQINELRLRKLALS